MSNRYQSNQAPKSAKKQPMNPLYIALIALGAVVLVIIGLTLANRYNLFSKDDSASEYLNAPHPIAVITMESGDQITLELYPDVAPNTVANFVTLANSGYYDGLTFHRVIPGFMIQGGCPEGTGRGNPGYSIKGEFSANGFENNLLHERGVISMARSNSPDSAGSQFFIMHEDSPHLDGSYAAFGKVISGMEAVDKIASAKTDYTDKPLTPQVIRSISVDTKGTDYKVTKIGG